MKRLATSLTAVIALTALSSAAQAQPRPFVRSGDEILEIGLPRAILPVAPPNERRCCA